MRVPRQASTKWWILLAAVLATLITWCQAEEHAVPGREPRPGSLERTSDDRPSDDGAIEFELEIDPAD